MGSGLDRVMVIGIGAHAAAVIQAAQQTEGPHWSGVRRIAWVIAEDHQTDEIRVSEALNSLVRLEGQVMLAPHRRSLRQAVLTLCLVVNLGDKPWEDIAEVWERLYAQCQGYGLDIQTTAIWIVPTSCSANLDHVLQTAGVAEAGSCYVGEVNMNGSRVATLDERVALGAEALWQWLWRLGAAAGPTRYPTRRVSALGIAAWVYPVTKLMDYVALKIARTILQAWLAPSAMPFDTQPADSIWLALEAEIEAGIEAADLSIARSVVAPLEPGGSAPLSWSRPVWETAWAVMAREWEEDATRLLEVRQQLAEQRVSRAQAIGVDLGQAVATWLDETRSGGLVATLARLRHLVERLAQRAEQARADQAKLAHTLARLTDERASRETTLTTLSAQLPTSGWAALGLGLYPPRLWRVWRTPWALRHQWATLVSLRIEWRMAQVEMLRTEWLAEMAEHIEMLALGWMTPVEHLAQGVRQAHDGLPPCQAGLWGAQGWALEQSILTPALLAELETQSQPDVAATLHGLAHSGVRLSQWLDQSSAPDEIVAACMAYGKRQAAPLGRLRADELLARRLELDSLAARVTPAGTDEEPPYHRPGVAMTLADVTQALVDAAAPWAQWDETRLPAEVDPPREEMWLQIGSTPSPLDNVAATLQLPLEIMPTNDTTRITLVRLAQGIPLQALKEDNDV